MTDPNDMELIEHIAGRGDSALQGRIDEALAASAELRARYDELAATWRLLGEADAALPARLADSGTPLQHPPPAEIRFLTTSIDSEKPAPLLLRSMA